MRTFTKPYVFASRCLGFAKCRYNGATIPDAFIEQLKPYVTYETTCPEVEIGLGAPREPVRMILSDEKPHLIQPATGKDVTVEMETFAKNYLEKLTPVDGFILKGRSPSCGIKDVKLYPGPGKVPPAKKGVGFFGKAVLEHYPTLPVEEEGRLKNYTIREHFLTQLFTMSDFRSVKEEHSMGALVRFQSDNKLLFMAYNQSRMRMMGRIVANPDKQPVSEILREYEHHLAAALSRPPSHTSGINVLMHALGYFSADLSVEEKGFFLDSLQRYRNHKVPLSVPVNIIGAWIARFGQPYLERQTFFAPYPEELISVSDSGKGRTIK